MLFEAAVVSRKLRAAANETPCGRCAGLSRKTQKTKRLRDIGEGTRNGAPCELSTERRRKRG